MSRHVDSHLERYLGQIRQGWKPVGEPQGVQVCSFDNQPRDSAVTYSTLGLSQHVLAMPDDRCVRQEIVLAIESQYRDHTLANLLFHVAAPIIHNHRAILRGDVIDPGGRILPRATCTHLYATSPVVFPDGFEIFEGSSPPTVLVWLIPITHPEAHFVHAHGWSTFEDALEENDPDLFDLRRSSIVS
jgi:hypothetical protein